MSYVPTPEHLDRNFDNPDALILRDANNFVHRVTGYIPHVLNGTEGKGQDGFVIENDRRLFRRLFPQVFGMA